MVKLNIDLPMGFLDEESRAIVVPSRRKQVWAVELDLLSQLDRVCQKHGISYFCDGGTLLGAARHRGFVPWDDDIDVVMARGEYNRLCELAPSEFSHPYFFQTQQTDPGSLRGHAQLRNSETTAILKCEMMDGIPLFKFNQGIFIDIFPFDNVPDDLDERRRFLDELQGLKNRIWALRHGQVIFARRKLGRLPFAERMSVAKTLLGASLRLRPWTSQLRLLHERMETLAQRYRNRRTREVAPITLNPHHREVLPAQFFEQSTNLQFEHIKIPVFKDYEAALNINYGNWHEHIVGCSDHGGMIIDVDRPYTDYIRR